MKKTKLAFAALAVCAGTALLAASLPGAGAKYVASVTVPYTVATHPTSRYFGYTGAGQGLQVPQDGYYAIQLWGARGGGGTPWGITYYTPGEGAYVAGVLLLAGGDTLTVQVGGAGSGGEGYEGFTPEDSWTAPGDGGYNGGGGGGGCVEQGNIPFAGGGGGGATDVRLNGNDFADRIIVAGGGGGAGGGARISFSSAGGAGGGGAVSPTTLDGVYGYFMPGNPGGSGYFHYEGDAFPGGFGYGGSGEHGSGGGGGGWYGGESPAGNCGGEGGMSFIHGDIGRPADALAGQLPGPDDACATWLDGYGYAIITYLGTDAPP